MSKFHAFEQFFDRTVPLFLLSLGAVLAGATMVLGA